MYAYNTCSTVMDYVIMGCPRGITDKKYDRNTLIFNFGFVFDKDCDTAPFESVVRKLGATFTIYEVVLSMNLSAFIVRRTSCSS